MPSHNDRTWRKKISIAQPDPQVVDFDAVRNFVTSAWVLSYSDYRHPLTPKRDWDYAQHALVSRTLSDGNNLALLAHDIEAPNLFYGFIVYTWNNASHSDPELVVHYAYVKHSFRRMGMMTEMLLTTGWRPGGRIRFTHECRHWNSKERCERWNAVYDRHRAFHE